MPDLVGIGLASSVGSITAVASTTSGVATFNLDILEIIEEAYEQAGLEMRNGYDLRTARRSLNLLALDWANRGFNLWVLEEGSIQLQTGVASYSLPADTIDVVEAVIRTSTSDTSATRMGINTYALLANKSTTGRPTQIWLDRQITPRVVVWPVPSTDDYSLVYWRMRRIYDAGTMGDLEYDIPVRFLPCLTAGLACKIAMKRPEAEARIQRLKAEYEELWANAAAEDREKVSIRLVPAL